MLLVSIHDVTPALELNVTRLWELCAQRRITPALLVVPNWHGEWPLEAHPRFTTWIRARATEGAEIVLHGERHDEVGLPRRFGDHWRAWGNTWNEGEFLTLDAGAAQDRVFRAVSRVRELGLDPTGFVPPGWLARDATYEAAAAAGLQFSEDDRSIRLLPSGRRVHSPVVRWSARTPARAWGSVAVAAGRWLLQRRSKYPRIALHPRDLEHRATERSLGCTLDRWLNEHRPGRYADLRAFVPAV
jgi:predicted deacetylase